MPTPEQLRYMLPNLATVAKLFGVCHSTAKAWSSTFRLPRHECGGYFMPDLLAWFFVHKFEGDRLRSLRWLNLCECEIVEDRDLLALVGEIVDSIVLTEFGADGLREWRAMRCSRKQASGRFVTDLP